MKMSEYAAKHANDGKSLNTDKMVSASSLVNEIITICEIARIEKTKFGSSAYLIKIDDATGFFTTSSITRQIDKYLKEGVTFDDLVGCRFLVMSKHLDDDPKTGKKACDFLQIEFVEDTKDEVSE